MSKRMAVFLGLLVASCSYAWAWLYTYGGLSKGVDTGSPLQNVLSVAISGLAIRMMNLCFNSGMAHCADLIAFAAYLAAPLLWAVICIWVSLVLRGRVLSRTSSYRDL